MIKFMLLAKRKPGTTREELMDYYENKHVPLIRRILPTAAKCHVRMNFIDHSQVLHPAEFTGEVEFDVVSESMWPDAETLNKFIEATADADVMAELIEDEEKLFDRSSMRFVTVDVAEVLPA